MKTTTLFRTLLLALLMAAGGFVNHAHAQYQSFFGDSITEYALLGWPEYYSTDHDPSWLDGCTYSFKFQKADTTSINGINYYVGLNNNGWPVYIREDTTLGRMYRIEYGCEWLVCDMSLSVGDTFYVPFTDMCWSSDRYPVPIIADTIFYINGLKYIQFRTIYEIIDVEMDVLGLFPDTTIIPIPSLDAVELHGIPIMFIEGIGPNYGPEGDNAPNGTLGSWFSNGQLEWLPNPFLLCVHKDGELAFMSSERAGCWQAPSSSIKDDNQSTTFKLYPNPAHNILNIRFENTPVQKGMLYITDMVGRVVFSQETSEQHLKINVKHLQAGLYVATWFMGGKKQSVKFVKK